METGKVTGSHTMTREEYMRRFYDGDEKKAVIQHRVPTWSNSSKKGKA